MPINTAQKPHLIHQSQVPARMIDSTEPSPATPRPPRAPRIALALAGGGPLGAIYEIGALCALDEALDGLDLTGLDHYVGVSAGGFLAAGLANRMSPRDLCAAFIDNHPDSEDQFDPAWLMRPAVNEIARRAIGLPGRLSRAAWQLLVERRSTLQVLEGLSATLPTGVFSNEGVHERMGTLFAKPGRSNDFRQLKTQLTLVATNLDSGETAPFGRPGWDHVPISRAIQASSALPGLFPPVEIDDQYFVDGALKKTMHASVVLDEGVDLLLCLNPLVPYDATTPEHVRVMQRGLPGRKRRIPRIVEGGLPAVLSQTFRTMIHSRMQLGMKHYERAYPHTDIVLIEPDHRDPELYLANTFSYAQRRELAEHAYQKTREHLRTQRTRLSAIFARHGITLNAQVLDDPRCHLLRAAPKASRIGRAVQQLQEAMDDLSYTTATGGTTSVA